MSSSGKPDSLKSVSSDNWTGAPLQTHERHETFDNAFDLVGRATACRRGYALSEADAGLAISCVS